MYFQFSILDKFYKEAGRTPFFKTNVVYYRDNFGYMQKVFLTTRLTGKPVGALKISVLLDNFKELYIR